MVQLQNMMLSLNEKKTIPVMIQKAVSGPSNVFFKEVGLFFWILCSAANTW